VQSMVQKNDDVEIEQSDEHSDAFGVNFFIIKLVNYRKLLQHRSGPGNELFVAWTESISQ